MNKKDAFYMEINLWTLLFFELRLEKLLSAIHRHLHDLIQGHSQGRVQGVWTPFRGQTF